MNLRRLSRLTDKTGSKLAGDCLYTNLNAVNCCYQALTLNARQPGVQRLPSLLFHPIKEGAAGIAFC